MHFIAFILYWNHCFYALLIGNITSNKMSSIQPPFWEEWVSGDEDFDLRPLSSKKPQKPSPAKASYADDLFTFDDDDELMKENSDGSFIFEPGQPSSTAHVLETIDEEVNDFEGFQQKKRSSLTVSTTTAEIHAPRAQKDLQHFKKVLTGSRPNSNLEDSAITEVNS